MIRESRPRSANAVAGLSVVATSSDTVALVIGNSEDNRLEPVPHAAASSSLGSLFPVPGSALRGIPALRQKQIRVAHIDDRVNRQPFVRRAIVERLRDPVADEVAEVAGAVRGGAGLVVEPAAYVPATHCLLELRPQLRFARDAVLVLSRIDVPARD